MSGRGSRVNSRITAVVDFMMRCPGTKVPEAMLAKNFSLTESSMDILVAKSMSFETNNYREVSTK